MGKKKENKGKIKWGKILMWIFGVSLGLVLVCLVGIKIWVSTWQTYRNDEFGFSFRYPKNWYISGYYDHKYEDGYRRISFYVDSKKELPNSPQDPLSSPGGVHVLIENNDSTLKAHKSQRDFSTFDRVRYGSKIGYTTEGVGRNADFLGNLYIYSKDFYVEDGKYVYFVTTNSTSSGVDFMSRLVAKYSYLIGSSVIDSFNFD